MKKLNNYLLLHYPQLWNLRIHFIFPAIALLHVIFYLAGYASFTMGGRLHRSYHIDNHFIDSGIGFSVLVSVLVILLWLVFYLRNNPFKSFYPLKRSYFLIEFTVIMLVFISGITFFESYAHGFWQSIRDKTRTTDITAETNTLNLAYGLMPTEKRRYTIHYSCDSLDFRDSLRMLERKVRTRLHPEDQHMRYNDAVVVDADEDGPEDFQRNYTNSPANINSDAVDDEIRLFDFRAKNDDAYYYTNFCYRLYKDDTSKLIWSKKELSDRMSGMLARHDRKAVEKVLSDFDDLCTKYEVDKHANVMSFMNLIFRDSTFRLYSTDFISQNSVTRETAQSDYIEFRDITESFKTIEQARTQHIDYHFWAVISYLSFGFSLLLFSYRLSARRPWFIALVGIGVLMILVFLSMIVIHGNIASVIEVSVIFASFLILHFVFRRAVRRTLAGVTLIWWSWALPFLGLLILEIVKSFFPYNDSINRFPHQYTWIQDHYWQLFAGYLLPAVIYTVTMLSALYRRWQAMPEE